MTKLEIAELVNSSRSEVYGAFQKAGTICESIKRKNGVPQGARFAMDFTLDETLLALKFIPYYTPMLEQYVRDNFFTRKVPYKDFNEKTVKYPNDIESFIYHYKKQHNYIRCCANCAFLNARSRRIVGRPLMPYCSFYRTFINYEKHHINVYKDRCKTWKFTNRPPFIFLSAKEPQNMNVFHRQPHSTLGIHNRFFTSKKTPSNDEPVLLKKIEWTK